MSNYVDLKYINILSARLEQFKQKGKKLFNFRCEYCGDSQKDKTKARGICMPSRMTCFINVITVVSVQTCQLVSKIET